MLIFRETKQLHDGYRGLGVEHPRGVRRGRAWPARHALRALRTLPSSADPDWVGGHREDDLPGRRRRLPDGDPRERSSLASSSRLHSFGCYSNSGSGCRGRVSSRAKSGHAFGRPEGGRCCSGRLTAERKGTSADAARWRPSRRRCGPLGPKTVRRWRGQEWDGCHLHISQDSLT